MRRMATKAIRHLRKLEKPRPLKQQQLILDSSIKTSFSVDEVIHELENLYININNGNFDKSIALSITKVCNQLKLKGQEIETAYKEQLDRYFVILRNASRDERVDTLCRMRLLEIIELRAMHWKINENMINYYKQKFQELEASELGTPIITTTTTNPMSVSYFPGQLTTVMSQPNIALTLGPNEILKSSGKFAKPTKIPGKNYFKDEIVIRNSDSGKVMGIKGRRVHMIEELSDTIISFQRVSPGARDRLVQITGQNEESINCSKVLIEDTIRRNASPVREKCHSLENDCSGSSTSLNSNLSEDGNCVQTDSSNRKKLLVHSYSMSDASLGEYAFTVTVGNDLLKISGCKVDLVKTAKLVLEEYFAGQAELMERQKNQQIMAETCLNINTSSNSKVSAVNSDTLKNNVELRNPSILKSGKSEESYTVSSSSDEETYKAEISPTEDDQNNENQSSFLSLQQIPLSPVECVRQSPLSPLESKGLPEKSYSSFDIRSYLMGKRSEDNYLLTQPSFAESKDTQGKNLAGFTYPIRGRIPYSRDFILSCAKSPFSQVPPSDFDEISQIVPLIMKEFSWNFDPEYYKSQVLSAQPLRTSRQNSVEKSDGAA